jgi:MFS family permease
MHLWNSRPYYGWIIVAISFLTMLCVMGTFFSSGVLFAALIAENGWSRAITSLPFSVALICYAGTAWLAGRAFDRYGPRRLFPIGILCLGLGLMTSAHARTPWHLCLTWGVLVGQGFNLAGFVPHLALIALWFQRQRGIAAGLAISGASLGAFIIVPSTQYMVEHYGWRPTYTLLGLIVMICLVPINLLWQRHRPADLGLYPDGAPTLPPLSHNHHATLAASSWTLRAALHSTRFWCLFAMVSVIGWLSNITSVHQLAHILDNGFPGLFTASIIGLMSLLRAAGSIIWGGLSDRFGREIIYTIGTLLCCAGLTCLAVLHSPASPWLLYGYALAYGFGYGVHGAVEASATADIFRGPHLGAILGTLELGWGLGGFGGTWFGGTWYDHWGSYHGAYALTIGLSLLGCGALWLAAPRRPAAVIGGTPLTAKQRCERRQGHNRDVPP